MTTRPPTPKGQRTEAAFLEAARKVFAEQGYFNAKIADIAAAAGKSPGSFYNYYENKEELLQALLKQFSLEVLENSFRDQSDDPMEGIRAAVRAYWTTYRKYLAEMVGVFQMSMTDEAFAERWREHRAIGIRVVRAGIRNAEKSGHPAGVAPGLLASAIVSTLESFCWVWLAAGGDTDVDAPDEEAAIETLSLLWYRTVYHRSPGE
ncbi:TetR family transcriptional regulator [Actinomadura sp. CNU-125]|uniref:TetR/AcrR family transcriptional regulator n=1 Tax=Actinomadura sp. CNU-125 TaxID=1904961 RepID=UPI00095B40C4|nr:TetR/AcrR family transcriptional regulator [Actinomadura sp. CNU-125]OLT27323.1 TetR family transcriptional regulator [Actinomadura sp. CNU-125]